MDQLIFISIGRLDQRCSENLITRSTAWRDAEHGTSQGGHRAGLRTLRTALGPQHHRVPDERIGPRSDAIRPIHSHVHAHRAMKVFRVPAQWQAQLCPSPADRVELVPGNAVDFANFGTSLHPLGSNRARIAPYKIGQCLKPVFGPYLPTVSSPRPPPPPLPLLATPMALRPPRIRQWSCR